MKISLFLLNKKGLIVLQQLVKDDRIIKYIDFIVTSRDKGNKEDCYKEINELAKNNNLKVYDREDKFEISSDYSIAIGWRWMLNIERKKLIVIHDSLLPKYRGFAPLVNMLINGEKRIGATMIFANEKMDEGDIIAQKSSLINYPIKIQKAIDLVALLYVELVDNFFNQILLRNKIKAEPQDNNKATYSIWRDEEDYRINWNDSAENIKRMIDAVGFPYGNAKTQIGNSQNLIEVIESEVYHENYKFELNHSGKVFKIENSNPIIICGQGLLKITKMLDKEGSEYRLKLLRTKFK